MSKPGRNDPCPCGSGKKYKKCCGNNNVISFNPILYKEELDGLQGQFIDFAFDNYQEELFDIVKHFANKHVSTTNERDVDTYTQMLLGWALLTVPVKDNKTVFDLFYDKTQRKIKRPAVKQAFAKWKDASPGTYEVFLNEENIKLINMETTEAIYVSNDTKLEYKQGNIALGILIPYVNTQEFFFNMIQLPGDYIENIGFLIDEKTPHDLTLKDVFPEFLDDILNLENDDFFIWDRKEYEIVATLYEEHARKKEYEEELIYLTMQFWSDFCELNQPIIYKTAAHAAALDYFSQVEFQPFTSTTQAQLAKEYGTSAGTISKHYRRMDEDFDLILNLKEDESDVIDTPPLNMEKKTRDLSRLLEEQEFESDEDMHAFVQDVLNDGTISPSDTPRDRAQDLLYDARDTSGRKRDQLIAQALTTHPNSPDAFVLLAEDEQNMNKRLVLIEKAIDAGEKDLGKKFFTENTGHFWGLVETRPYMRAKAMYAFELEQRGSLREAIDVYKEMLELNPNDNQGIRYLLLPLYIMNEKHVDAYALIEAFDEPTAAFMFNKALLHYKQYGITKEGLKVLKEATESNPFVLNYLLEHKAIPTEQSNYVGLGDETEAIAYAQENAHLWKGAEEFLKKV